MKGAILKNNVPAVHQLQQSDPLYRMNLGNRSLGKRLRTDSFLSAGSSRPRDLGVEHVPTSPHPRPPPLKRTNKQTNKWSRPPPQSVPLHLPDACTVMQRCVSLINSSLFLYGTESPFPDFSQCFHQPQTINCTAWCPQ